MNSFIQFPKPFTDGIHSNVEIYHLSLKDRLRILFGAGIFVEVDTLVEHSPGRLQSKSNVHIGKVIPNVDKIYVQE